MKRILVYTIAALMAITANLSATQPKQYSSNREDALYWYPVTTYTQEIIPDLLINNTPMTKSELRLFDLIPCPEIQGTHCLRGFFDIQEEAHDLPGNDYTEKAAF